MMSAKITTKIQLEGLHTVWAYVYRDGDEVAFKGFGFMFRAAFTPWREHKALQKCYDKANAWANRIAEVERNADRGTHEQ